MNLKPLSDHILLEPVEEEKATASGIIIPDTADKEKPVKAKVLAVGDGKKNDKGELMPLSVKVGDTVLFKKYGPDEVELDNKKYLIAEEADILAIIEDETTVKKEEQLLAEQIDENKKDNLNRDYGF